MKLTIGNISVEGKDQKEIEWLLEKVKELRETFPQETIPTTSGSGRLQKYINFPKGPFTVQDLAAEEGVTPATIYTRLKEMESNGDARIVGEVKREGVRGKGAAQWQIINFPAPPAASERSVREVIDIDTELNPE